MAKRSSLNYGSHILWVYRDKEEYETILRKLVGEGLSKGERVIIIGSSEDISRACTVDIQDEGISYLILEKGISEFIKDSEIVFKSWYTRVISTVDETEEKTLKELLETSSKIDRVCRNNVIWICAYDINSLSPMSLLHLVQAHPYLMIGEEILENFIFVPQDKIISATTRDILDLILDILRKGEDYKSNLKSTLDLYKALFEATGTATVVIEDTIIVSINEAFETLTGFTKEEVEGKRTWMEFIPFQEDLNRMLRYRELRLRDPSLAPKSYETRIKDKSGNIKEVMVTVETIPGTKKFVASISDITEIKRLNRALRILSFANQELIRAREEKELVRDITDLIRSYEDYKDIKIEVKNSKVRIILDREISDVEKDIFNELSRDIEYGINVLRTRNKLEYSEERYRNIFENVPVALFEIDISGVTVYIKELLDLGIRDLGAYFSSHEEELDKILELFRIVDVNRFGLELCGVKSKEELEKDICKIIPKIARKDYVDIILSLLEGIRKGDIFTHLYTLAGEERQVHLKWLTPPPRE
ncbi:MAG: PAS domain S-box protein [bacterium]|nr:PAS domain S-box protein [bacterium]